MKILLDECVPVQLRQALPLHDVFTTQQMGWKGLGNGDLLNQAERNGFDLLIIADKNLRYQQNLTRRKIAIVELWTNHRPTLEKYFAEISKAVDQVSPGQYLIVEQP